MRAQIPNALSVLRIFLALAIILLSYRLELRTYIATIAIVAIAITTDLLDGYLARRWRITSELGYVLDAMGDRAVHLALVLVILVRYEFHPIFVWLLIFRDIGIYAVRILSKNWFRRSLELRWISLAHATNIRIWFGLFILRDGFRVFDRSDVLNTRTFDVIQMTLLCCTIGLSYYGLFRAFNWLIDKEHEGCSKA